MRSKLRDLGLLALLSLQLGAGSPGPITVKDAWLRVPRPGSQTAAVYLTLENSSGTPQRVTSITVTGASGAELHETTHGAGGAMGMHRLEFLDIPPRGHLALAPGGTHVMVFDYAGPAVDAGSKAAPLPLLTLTLASGAKVQAPLALRQ